jgi:glycosyltransferase involved in cell wall biosynthesis
MPTTDMVSVVIPVYNAARFLADAIRSVQAQHHPQIEIVVVDDGSTDGSGEVARSFAGVRCLPQANLGIAAARNAGVREARGTLLAFLDADDLWTPDKLPRQIEVLHEIPEASFVSGLVEQFFDPAYAPPPGSQVPATSTGCVAGSILIRTRDFLRVGPFNPALRLGEFMDWHSRATDLGLREHRLEQVVLRRRIHGANTVLRCRNSAGDYLAAMKAHLDRKRRAA